MNLTRRVAGHIFGDAPGGRSCALCGVLWTQIASATKDDIGRVGISHDDRLTADALAEIETERDRIWLSAWAL